jgi:hypothetical protein
MITALNIRLRKRKPLNYVEYYLKNLINKKKD